MGKSEYKYQKEHFIVAYEEPKNLVRAQHHVEHKVAHLNISLL